MNDINSQSNNRPRLKKVKRPIRRDAPIKNFEDPIYNVEDMEDVDLNSLDLDSYLDNDPETQIPTTTNVPTISTQAPLTESEEPRFLGQDDVYYPEEILPHWFTKRNVIIALIVSFVVGVLIANLFFAPSQVVRNGLQGLIPNPEVPKGRARCGLTDKTQGCVLYIMNPQRQELAGRDFYDLASQLTGRQRFVIETGNMRYSNTKIRPGEIGQFNIPPL